MSEQKPGRDEKGLTISGRTMLRLLMEFGKALLASRKLGNQAGYELLQSPTILLEIRALLWIASQMAKRIGSKEEVESYLETHREEDEKAILDGMIEASRALLDDVLAHGGLKKCPSCSDLICPICQKCHKCTEGKDHGTLNPFDFPSNEKPN